MDTTIADLMRFNDFLDSSVDPNTLDEEFITARQVELESISRNSDVDSFPFLALSYAKLMELTLFLAGRYSDNCRIADFGDLVVNPRHMDVCILNTGLIKDAYGITDGIPLWFKRHVRESVGSRYAEDLGRMVVDPSLLSRFVDEGLLLATVKKERHERLSDQFRSCIQGDPRPTFFKDEDVASLPRQNVVGCGGGRGESHDVASWLAENTVLNMVTGTLKSDLMDVLRDAASDDYLKSIDARFEKAFNSLHYVSVGRKTFVNFPYDDEVRTAEWDEINRTLCHFTLEGYGVIQGELDKSLSEPWSRSRFLNGSLYDMPRTQDAGRAQLAGSAV
ncbi:hypothetical protein [Pseudodesulfovibrio indicus]|uniref:Uncharacterized protein n=1 Tax=Pseudodesulfovibrio indicus TaxID=1716143 RepID=A0A126QRW0_9BACT|nr:hypothetical protein [Pseudodesulfovibrio indicus]AMK12800.1 hypothetical protein AWY79_17655 [Pseudodesulfovibrio indicus]TDT86710.1 hypothetical protein EDC59_11128 [Pseudodesulfovibrio indicus]